MMGRQDFQPQLFSSISIESLIPQNHLLRRIDRLLDLNFVRELTMELYSQNNGRPSIDPELFIRMLIITYFYNIKSDRRLCEEIGFNLAYRWFCRLNLEDKVPDHSSLTRIRDRFGEDVFRQVFERVVELCAENGLVEARELMMDASLVKANASLSSLVDKSEGEIASSKCIKGKRFSNDTHASHSDPEATLAGKVGEKKSLCYKVHNSVDPSARVIVNTHVGSGNEVEGTLLFEQLDQVQKQWDYKVATVTADRGYGYGENLVEIQNRGIESFVPNFHSDVGGQVERQGFSYNSKEQTMTCPAGHAMRVSTPPSMAKERIVFITKQGQCKGCPRLLECKPAKDFRKKISLGVHYELQQQTKEREKTDEFKAKLRERMWKVEGLFAEAKNLHGLQRARYRGRVKMQIQAYLVASVQNLKRILTYQGLQSLIGLLDSLIIAVTLQEKRNVPNSVYVKSLMDVPTHLAI